MRTIIGMAIVLVAAGFIPAVSGHHLSIGSQDGTLLSPTESPTDRSVTPADFTRGTATGCYDPTGEVGNQPAEATAATTADAFCGRLVFNQGTTFVQGPTRDQDLRGTISTFDVVYASYVGNYGLSTCAPWCLPGGREPYEALNDAGNIAGLTPTGAEAWSDDQGWQEYALNFLYPNALLAVNDELGLFEMNGWAHTIHDQQFVAFLEDANGPIDEDGLKALVAAEITAGNLGPDAAPQVCAFTDDFRIVINAPQATFCEVIFVYAEEPPAGQGAPDDPCASPAYVCGTLTPGWYAQLVCKTFFATTAINPGSFGCAGGGFPNTDGPAWSDNDYDVWNFVVGPTQSACNGGAEPGMAFSTSGNWPYLAYDLDVYSPAATAAGLDQTESIQRWADAVVDENGPTVSTGGVSVASLVPTQLRKDDTVEPNAAGDTSRSQISISRASDPCAVFAATPEDVNRVDPWVDQLDNHVIRDGVGEVLAGGRYDPFLTSDPSQDGSNRPGPFMYFMGGNVGIFADKNDDGDYDAAGSAGMWTDVESVGAYPLFWDLWLKPDSGSAVIDPDGGCRPGFGDGKLTAQMAAAGYGVNTGMIQVVYLNEPTYWFNWETSDVTPYLDGDTAFVLMSQGLHVMRTQGSTAQQNAVNSYIQSALNKLPTPKALADVVFPAEDIGLNPLNDFFDQCSEGTGGFTMAWGFFHACQLGCSNDAVVTEYVVEITRSDRTIGGGGGIQKFTPGNVDFTFPGTATILQWYDVDPLDNDPSKNSASTPP